ncbi:hypothetical protein PROFUN_04816 [Planoprotostelium fungivorum]|uniref:Uncharacterized protein n=1 Tax=Planoprotostelium fungivorum TaxID=1890364 RepID=A0A2P6NT27_9EUKA|nr:hypothetical protein PROFUN_04816 [Planoprotostelium fungivorum]
MNNEDQGLVGLVDNIETALKTCIQSILDDNSTNGQQELLHSIQRLKHQLHMVQLQQQQLQTKENITQEIQKLEEASHRKELLLKKYTTKVDNWQRSFELLINQE